METIKKRKLTFFGHHVRRDIWMKRLLHGTAKIKDTREEQREYGKTTSEMGPNKKVCRPTIRQKTESSGNKYHGLGAQTVSQA